MMVGLAVCALDHFEPRKHAVIPSFAVKVGVCIIVDIAIGTLGQGANSQMLDDHEFLARFRGRVHV
jgi:hypothetical protein